MNSLLFHVTNFMKINHKNAKKILNCMKLIFECMKCHSRCKDYKKIEMKITADYSCHTFFIGFLVFLILFRFFIVSL